MNLWLRMARTKLRTPLQEGKPPLFFVVPLRPRGLSHGYIGKPRQRGIG